jgi:hypothetical protein
MRDERRASEVAGMDVERTSIPRIRWGGGDGLGCYDFASREIALSELVARPRICTFCHSRGGVMPVCSSQRQAVLRNGARRSPKGFKPYGGQIS